MARKNTWKNAVLSERKRCDIFPPLGVPLCALDLQNAAFVTKGKLKKSLKNEMARKNTCKNAVLSERKRSDIFPPLGVPLCALDLQNAAFATEVKLKKSLKNEMARKNTFKNAL